MRSWIGDNIRSSAYDSFVRDQYAISFLMWSIMQFGAEKQMTCIINSGHAETAWIDPGMENVPNPNCEKLTSVCEKLSTVVDLSGAHDRIVLQF